MRNPSLMVVLTCWAALMGKAAVQTSYKPVSLKVTVNSNEEFDPSAGTVTGVSPDSSGQYLDGQNGVCASLNSAGDLVINFDCKPSSRPRRLGLNLADFLAYPTSANGSSCMPPTAISPSNPPVAYTNTIDTLQATDTRSAPFQAMAVYDGSDATTYYVQFYIGTQFSDASQTAYRLNYHRTAGAVSPSDAARASYAEVRRMSPTTWVLEPVTPSGLTSLGDPPNVAMLVWMTTSRHQSTTTECGFYQVPFSFTLEQQ